MHQLNRKTVHAAFITVVCLIIYSNTLSAPFYWDDAMLIESPIIKSFDYFLHPATAGPFSWYGGFLSRYFGYLTFALNYRLGALDVTGYHLVNIGIHLIASLLVYRLVLLVMSTPYFREGRDHDGTDSRAGFIAFLAALLFAAHPIQTQAVTYIVQRFASLATMLYLLSLTGYLKGRLLSRGPLKRPLAAGAWFASALLAGLLALKSKEIAYTLPLAVLLFELLLFTRDAGKRAVLLALGVLPVLALVATRVSGGSLAEIATNLDRATRLQTGMSRWDYLATQCRVIVTYLRLLILPVGQRLDYDYQLYTSFTHPKVLMSAALLVSLLAGALVSLRLSRGREDDRAVLLRVVALGILWFFVTLAIESSVIPIVDVIFEHRVYLPSVGLFIAAAAYVSLAGGAGGRIPGWPGWRVGAGCLAVLLLLGAATHARNRLWSDQVAFWRDNAAKTPQKPRVLINLARALEAKGDLANAREAYLAAMAGDPMQTDSLLNLGLMEIRAGRLEQALLHFQAALGLDPSLAEAHNNIGKVYGMQSRFDEAIKEFLLVVQLNPTMAEPHNNLGFVYAQQKRYDEALTEYGKCLALYPDYEKAYINRGATLLATGRKADALADYRRALRINPNNVEAAQQLRLAERL